jgi:putative SOS response-associated peptidase YedK
MCYNVKGLKETQLKRAKRQGNDKAAKEIIEDLNHLFPGEHYQVSGFSHPSLVVYLDKTPFIASLSIWGLIPSWVQSAEQKLKLWNNTLNARGESIFDKPSFKSSAQSKRCIIPIDGFYEYHWKNEKSFPYYISRKDGETMNLAGLYENWVDVETGEEINSCTIVTTEGNELMERIHNNPKLDGPRMPVILEPHQTEDWLITLNDDADKEQINALLKPSDNDVLIAHTVNKLKGKNVIQNSPSSADEFIYPELLDNNSSDQLSLFNN